MQLLIHARLRRMAVVATIMAVDVDMAVAAAARRCFTGPAAK
jgi:hypothetical protein